MEVKEQIGYVSAYYVIVVNDDRMWNHLECYQKSMSLMVIQEPYLTLKGTWEESPMEHGSFLLL